MQTTIFLPDEEQSQLPLSGMTVAVGDGEYVVGIDPDEGRLVSPTSV